MPAASSSPINPAIGQLIAAVRCLDEEEEAGGCCRCWPRCRIPGRAGVYVTSWR